MKFSIITITSNRAHLIEETIESVLNQTYQNFEYIIIDDGSTDNTKDVVMSFKEKRINYFKYTKQLKRSFLRNEGIRKAKGDIICILDSDDIWYKNKLDTLFEIFNTKKEVAFILHNVLKSNDCTIYKYKTDFYKNILNDVISNNILPYPFYSFRKSILNTFEIYDENMVDGQHDFFLRIASQINIYYCSKILSFKKTHTENISNTPRISALINYDITLGKLLNQNKLTRRDYIRYRSKNYYKIAKFYFKAGEKENGIKYLNQILKETQFNKKIHLKSLILKISNV